MGSSAKSRWGFLSFALASIVLGRSVFASETAPAIGDHSSSSYRDSQYHYKAERCRAFAEENPELKDLLHLDSQPPPSVGPIGYARACLKGNYEAFIDPIVETLSLPYELWNREKESSAATKKLTMECQKSEKCLELLHFQAYGSQPSETELERLKTANFGALDVLHRNARSRMNSTGMQNQIFREQIENKKWANWKSSSSPNEKLSPNEDTSWFWAAMRQSMENYAEKWYCLKPEVAVEFYCYNLVVIIQSVSGGAAVVQSPRIVRLLKGKALEVQSKARDGMETGANAIRNSRSAIRSRARLMRFRTLDSLEGKRFDYAGANASVNAPKFTELLNKHVKLRHVHPEADIKELLLDDATESALLRVLRSKHDVESLNQTIATTLYSSDTYDKVLSHLYANTKIQSGKFETLPGAKFSTEKIDVKVDVDGVPYEVQMRICRDKECIIGESSFGDGDITQMYIKCGPGGMVLPPFNCVKFIKDKNVPNLPPMVGIRRPRIETCRQYFEGGISKDKATGRSTANGKLRALKSPPCE